MIATTVAVITSAVTGTRQAATALCQLERLAPWALEGYWGSTLAEGMIGEGRPGAVAVEEAVVEAGGEGDLARR